MSKQLVTKVRKQICSQRFHHIVGVLTNDGQFHSNETVVNSIAAGQKWVTSVPSEPEATIKRLATCPRCNYGPYLTTAPDHSTKNNLENLPQG